MLKSLTHIEEDTLHSLQELREWIQLRNQQVAVNVELIPLSQMDGWHTDEDGNLRHNSGHFFSIEGIHVQTDVGYVAEWDQPIINQPEIGYLGIIAKEFNGVLHFLMQAKIEPGNVNCVQISPTLQATKSNYTQQHKGRKPLYLEYFQNAKPHQVLLDQLQSEQGARFLHKRNRNIIIRVDEEVPTNEDFRWMTLGQIKALMHEDNLVNMDTRTVLAGIDFGQLTTNESSSDFSPLGRDMLLSSTTDRAYQSMNDHLSWLADLKANAVLTVRYKGLRYIREWGGGENSDVIRRKDGKFFQVIGTRISIANREVVSWCQPLVQPMNQGVCAFIIKKINGIYHFLVHAKMECGNLDIYELAPTVQCLTGNLMETPREQWPAYADYVLNVPVERIHYSALQSEEGGRFYHEQNRNMIIEAEDDFPIDTPKDYHWMTLRQIFEFLRFNNYINIQARSLIAAIKYV